MAKCRVLVQQSGVWGGGLGHTVQGEGFIQWRLSMLHLTNVLLISPGIGIKPV